MVQHAARLDQVEGLADSAEPQKVSLRIFDRKSELARLADSVGKACGAEIDRQDARARDSAAGIDRMRAGAATRDKDVRPATRGVRVQMRARALRSTVFPYTTLPITKSRP